jgi:hypothetical protein
MSHGWKKDQDTARLVGALVCPRVDRTDNVLVNLKVAAILSTTLEPPIVKVYLLKQTQKPDSFKTETKASHFNNKTESLTVSKRNQGPDILKAKPKPL